MDPIDTIRTTFEHHVQAANTQLDSVKSIAHAWAARPEERQMSLNTLPVAEKALQESVDGIVTCVSKPTRLAGSNTELNQAHVWCTKAMGQLERFTDPDVATGRNALNLTLLRIQNHLIAARDRLQSLLDQGQPAVSHQPSKPMFTMDMEF